MQAVIQMRAERFHHHDSENSDGQYSRDPRHGIVNSRGRADAVLVHGIHHHRR